MVANDGGLCSAVQFFRVSLSSGPGTNDFTATKIISKFITRLATLLF